MTPMWDPMLPLAGKNRQWSKLRLRERGICR
jgi:hypothetical protein